METFNEKEAGNEIDLLIWMNTLNLHLSHCPTALQCPQAITTYSCANFQIIDSTKSNYDGYKTGLTSGLGNWKFM